MEKENLKAHNAELTKRYGIKEIDSFRRAARRYECRLNRLNELQCDNERLCGWAEKEATKVENAARRNLAKYCRNHKLFTKELCINSDPRGYALKLEIEHNKVSRNFLCKVDRDWGHYFIIAPELS